MRCFLKSGRDGRARQGRRTTASAGAGRGRAATPAKPALRGSGLITGGTSQAHRGTSRSWAKVAPPTIGRPSRFARVRGTTVRVRARRQPVALRYGEDEFYPDIGPDSLSK